MLLPRDVSTSVAHRPAARFQDEAEVERQSASVYEAFAGRLEVLVRQGPTLDARAQRRTSFALGTPLEDKPLASQEERWLCTMANCQQMLDWIAPRLCAKHSELHLALGARHAVSLWGVACGPTGGVFPSHFPANVFLPWRVPLSPPRTRGP